MIQELSSLESLHGRYDTLLCDVWGVVHNGKRAFGAACAALQAFRAAGGEVVLLTNAPRPHTVIPAQLDRLGVPRDSWDRIVTAGDAARAILAAKTPGPMYRIGPVQDRELWEGLGLAEAPLSSANFLLVSGLRNDATETPEDYRTELTLAAARQLELVCANPDITVRYGERLLFCAGALAQLYEALGGAVTMAGKPHGSIYTLALSQTRTDRMRVLCIGDGLGTDLLGARRQEIDAIFVAGGMHGDAFLHGDGGIDRSRVAAAFAEAGVGARFVMSALR